MKPRDEEDVVNYLLHEEGGKKAAEEESSDSDFDLNVDLTAADADEAPSAPRLAGAETQALDSSDVEEDETPAAKTPSRSTSKPTSSKTPAAAASKTPGKSAAPKSADSTPDSAKSSAPGKSLVLGDYRLISKLGQGGMGAVYKAYQISLEREVALKVLSKELAAKPAFVQRFEREAKVMAKMDHPNILRCYEVKKDKGQHFLAMEYVDGGSVESWLKKLGKFSIGDALCIVLTVARALEHAHELKLIHRDIKPDNILLTKKGVIKLADLGLAKATDDDLSLTKTGTGAGTPIYMAPEQARDVKHVDGRVDIYALGVMLYVFLTGEAPFKGETLVELIEAKEKGKFKPIRQLNDEVPERLSLIVDKMLAKKPEHRHANCSELIADLEELGLHNEALSFLGSSAGAPTKKAPTQTRTKPTEPPKEKAAVTAAPPSEFYYWQFTDEDGQTVTKKLKKAQVVTLIKTGSVDAQDQISRTPKGGYRSLATYQEFQQYFKGLGVKEKADKQGEKYRELYKQIESEEKSRLRWRWLHNLTLKAGGFVGLMLWLAIVAAVVVGGYFLVRWGLTLLGERVQSVTNT